MKTLAKETYQIIRLNFRNLILFELIYRIGAGVILYQMVRAGLKFSLKMAGFGYLTPENAVSFLLKPWTILFVLILAVSGFILVLTEIGGLVTVYSGAAYSLRLSLFQIFAGAVKKLIDEVKQGNYSLFLVGMANYVLVNLCYIYRILTHVKPMNFVAGELWQSVFARFTLLVFLAAFVALVVPGVFTFHGCMIEQKLFQDSLDRSISLLRGRKASVFLRQFGYQVVLAGGFLLAYLGCTLAVAFLVVLLAEKETELVLLIQITERVEWIFLFLAGMTAMIVHIALVTVEYYEYTSFQKRKGQGWDFFYLREKLISRRNGLILLIGAGAAVFVCLFDIVYNGNSIRKSVIVQTGITAHRGGAETPENTMAAIMAAVEQMADRVEIDVQETADGFAVLCHDDTLKRVAFLNKKVSDLTLEELQTLDVGSWYSSEFSQERIPTLNQVMEYAKGKIDLNIEIKNMGNDSMLPDKVLALVLEHEMKDQCIITSTNHNYLKRLKEMEPEIKTGYIIPAAYGDYYSDEFVDVISIRSSFVTERMLQLAHEQGKAVHAWTVNGKAELERLERLGVDDIITDYPILAREILYEDEGTAGLLEYWRLMLTK